LSGPFPPYDSKMSVAIISDLHIHGQNSPGQRALESFFSHPLVVSADEIVFLGDVFDLMVGNYIEFLEEQSFFFRQVHQSLQNGKVIKYIEGNHDFHLGELFESEFGSYSNFSYHQSALMLYESGKAIYLCHGDDIEIDNKSYMSYRAIIRSKGVQLLAESKVIAYNFVKSIGESASAKSRARNKEKYGDTKTQNWIKERFRSHALRVLREVGADSIICGHSHVMDQVDFDQGSYTNNGFPSLSGHFVLIESGQPSLIKL
jgi:UDP-2,3-diacylglucosamine hydrolase